jgi:hypothetical protein
MFSVKCASRLRVIAHRVNKTIMDNDPADGVIKP